MILKQKKYVLFSAFAIVLSFFCIQIFIVSEIVSAECSNSTGNDNCDTKNFQDAKKAVPSLTPTEWQKIVDQCQNTASVGGYGIFPPKSPITTPETGRGNCSNAVRSCFIHETNPEACYDGKVAALVTRCNNGNVDAGGENNGTTTPCGVDSAIKTINDLEGTGHESNKDIYDNHLEDFRESCDNPDLYATPAKTNECKELMKLGLDVCLGEQGFRGQVNTRIDLQKLYDCMRGKAFNAQMCEAAGGVPRTSTGPDGKTKLDGCDDPPPTVDNPDKPDDPAGGPGNNITRTNKKCGAEARVNILECDETGGATTLSDVLRIFVVALSFCVGIAAVGGIGWSAVKYASAQDNQSNLSEARERIRNIIIGLILFGFLLAIVNWLVPGGVIG